jgi:hypothetical protein
MKETKKFKSALKLHIYMYKDLVLTSEKKKVSIIKNDSHLIEYREIISVYCENHI